MIGCMSHAFARLSLVVCLMNGALVFARDATDGDERQADLPREVRIGRVSVDRLNVRARPGTTFEVVGRVVRDQALTIVGEEGDWLAIRPPDDTVAWCSRRFIDADGRITGDNVRVRSGPGVVFSVFSTLPFGTLVEPVGEADDEWQQIVVPTDATVWVHGQFVELDEAPDGTGEEDDQRMPTVGDAIVDQATTNDDGVGDEIPKLSVRDIARIDAGETTVGAVMSPIRKTPVAGKPADDSAIADDDRGLSTGAVLPGFDDTFAETDAALREVMIDESFIEKTDRGEVGETTVQSSREAREGVLVSLKTKATEFATHVLVVRNQDDTAHLLCYVVSDLIDLSEWENHQVRVYGTPISYPNWRTDVLHTTGIQLLQP